MLRAILQGKAGRITAENRDAQSWRDVFRLREDLLTSLFFSRIRYLSLEGEKKVLSLLIGEDAAGELGEVKEYNFWPKLKGVENRSFVEPDVLIICETAWILVEVKPPLGGQQYVAQWRNEIAGLVAQGIDNNSEWQDMPSTIHFVALGNNATSWNTDAQALGKEFSEFGLQMHIKEWEEVNHGLAKLRNSENGRDIYVYDDWKEAFALFGLIDRSAQFGDMLKIPELRVNKWQDIFREWKSGTKADEHHLDEVPTGVAAWLSLYKLAHQSNLRVELWN